MIIRCSVWKSSWSKENQNHLLLLQSQQQASCILPIALIIPCGFPAGLAYGLGVADRLCAAAWSLPRGEELYKNGYDCQKRFAHGDVYLNVILQSRLIYHLPFLRATTVFSYYIERRSGIHLSTDNAAVPFKCGTTALRCPLISWSLFPFSRMPFCSCCRAALNCWSSEPFIVNRYSLVLESETAIAALLATHSQLINLFYLSTIVLAAMTCDVATSCSAHTASGYYNYFSTYFFLDI